jgi:hypothetical protein
MASSKPSKMNSQPVHTQADDERSDKWKMSPSTEVTADHGENARRALKRKVEENTPRSRRVKPAPH